MSTYSHGSFGNIVVGSKIVYIYGLNMDYDHVSYNCEDDQFDTSDISFPNVADVGDADEIYRCGKGVVESIEIGEWHTEYRLKTGELIEDGIYMVIEESGAGEFIEFINTVMYPINALLKALTEMRKYRQNILKFAGIVPVEPLSVKECASMYGETVYCEWLDPSGSDWLNKTMIIDADFLREMEKHTIRNVRLK